MSPLLVPVRELSSKKGLFSITHAWRLESPILDPKGKERKKK